MVTQVTASATTPIFPPIQWTEESMRGYYRDIQKLLTEGNIVVLHGAKGATNALHKLSEINLDKQRVVYINCGAIPYFLAEVPKRILQEQTGVMRIDPGPLADRICDLINVPHKESFALQSNYQPS